MLIRYFFRMVPVLFGALALFSSPATAGVIITAAVPYGSAPIEDVPRDVVAPCIGYVFDTAENAAACVAATLPSASGRFWRGGDGLGGYRYVKDAADGCIQIGGSQEKKYVGGPARVARASSPTTRYIVYAPYQVVMGRDHSSYPLADTYTSNACQVLLTGANTSSAAIWFAYDIVSSTEPGDEGPDLPDTPHVPEETCELDEGWAWGSPSKWRGQVGLSETFRPAVGDNFWRIEASMERLPFGKDAAGYKPGSVIKVSIGEGKSCNMWRMSHVVTNDARSLYQYLGQPDLDVPPGDGGGSVKGNPVRGATKISKPIVPYGSAYDAAGKVRLEATIAEVIAEKVRELRIDLEEARAALQAENALSTPVEVEVECARIGNQCLVERHHPAAEQLVRDNPSCNEAWATCAWSPSPTQPVTSETKKEDLVRLSNDGQSVVRNDPTIYNNTIYPTVMVEAGTAPDNTADPGSVDNPGDGEGDSVDGNAVRDCLAADGECNLTDAKVREYLESIGVDPDRDFSVENVGQGVLERALASGNCPTLDATPYCSLVAGFAQMASRPVPAGDFVWWRGEILTGAGKSYHEAAIPRELMDFMKAMLTVLTSLSALSIILRGRPW